MDEITYYMVLCIFAVIAGLLIILLVLEHRRRKKEAYKTAEAERYYNGRMEDMQKIYAKLLPVRLLKMLDVNDAAEITTGLQQEFTAAVMYVNTMDYIEAVHNINSGKLFADINRVFKSLIPVILEKGGMIDKFERAGMSGLFTENNENAVEAAVLLCDAVEKLDDKEEYKGFSIGLTYGEVMFGVVGHSSRLSAVAMSESITLARFLQRKALKYYARILVTYEFIQCIEDFHKKYNSRLLGYFYDQTRDKMVRIYDIYDGDAIKIKQSKRKTRLIFEQGVDRYIQGDYQEARLYFVEVLKADRNDLAAKEYLYL